MIFNLEYRYDIQVKILIKWWEVLLLAIKNRVLPYGIGKTFIIIRLDELPKDIQQGVIDRFEKRDDKLKVTKDTVNIVIACEDIFAKDE